MCDTPKEASACYETEEYIFVSIQTMLPTYSLIYKKSSKTYNVQSLDKLGICGMGTFASTGHDFISYCAPTKENIEKILGSIFDASKENKGTIANLSEESNPILIFFSFD